MCRRCYCAYAYLVRSGQATWAGLEMAGLVLARALPFKTKFLGGVPWAFNKGKP